MSTISTGTPESVVQNLLTDEPAELHFVSPTVEMLAATVSVLYDHDHPPTTTVFASGQVLRAVRDDFPTAWRAADLVTADTLTLFETTVDHETALVLVDDAIWPLATIADTTIAIGATESERASEIRSSLIPTLEGEPFHLRTPGRTQVRETLAESISEGMRDDFETGIELLEEIETAALDEQQIALLAGAANEALLYDLGLWAEQIRFGSKATLSRKKSKLEDEGVVATEKVPVEVGRPRQRLQIGSELDVQEIRSIIKTAEERLDAVDRT